MITCLRQPSCFSCICSDKLGGGAPHQIVIRGPACDEKMNPIRSKVL